jgi:hypothetical protein
VHAIVKAEVRDVHTFYSPELNDLAKRLLAKNPLQRPSIQELLEDPLIAPVVDS